MIHGRAYYDGWWLRIGRFSIGKDDPYWVNQRLLAEREGWERVWRWRRYRVTWRR